MMEPTPVPLRWLNNEGEVVAIPPNLDKLLRNMVFRMNSLERMLGRDPWSHSLTMGMPTAIRRRDVYP